MILLGLTGQQHTLFNSITYRGWELSLIDDEGRLHTHNTVPDTAIGELTDASLWNGILFGKAPSEE